MARPCRNYSNTSIGSAWQTTCRFLGLVRDVPALLRQARMYVLSSVSEGVSLTLLEAMACGLPIVATRVGGTPEVVSDGVTGLLVPPRDPPSLAAAMPAATGCRTCPFAGGGGTTAG